jgi:hypothetical protein
MAVRDSATMPSIGGGQLWKGCQPRRKAYMQPLVSYPSAPTASAAGILSISETLQTR